MLVREVAGADEGAGEDCFDARGFAGGFVFGELVGVDPAVDGQVVAGGLEVLAEGDDVAGVAAGGIFGVAFAGVVAGDAGEVGHEFHDFVLAFADADHDGGFGDAALGLDAAEQFHRAVVAGAGPHGGVAALHGFEVVGDDGWFGVDDHLEGGFVALEVTDEDFEGHVGAGVADADDGFGPEGGAAVGEVVAVDGGDDDVLEAEASEGFGDSSGFVAVGGWGLAGLDVTKSACSGAGVAQDHDGGDASVPAFADVWACCFFADGVEAVGAHVGFGALKCLSAGHFGAEPVWFSLGGELL